MSVSTLNSTIVTRARVQLPKWGIPYVQCTLDRETSFAPGSAAVFVLEDLTIQGTILSGGASQGRSEYRIVGGKGGWGRSPKTRSETNDAGIKASKVVLDAATAVGETIDVSNVGPDVRVGPHFARPEEPASAVLEQVFPRGWYVGEDGVTRIGARPAGVLPAGAVIVEPLNRATNKVVVASDKIASILPGGVVDGMEVVDVCHELTEDSLRSTLWGASPMSDAAPSRELAGLWAVLNAWDPLRKFRAPTEYRVVKLEGHRLSLQPVRVSLGMPTLPRVFVRGLPSGYDPEIPEGSRVLVGFVDADPARPVVLGFEDPDSDGFQPAAIKLAGGGAAVARVGDSIKITAAALTAAGGANGSGNVTFTNDATGTVTSGSSKVECG